jgi:hypothetical protein
MNEMKKFEYEGNEITFLTGDNTMVNATEMAKQFEVQPSFWLRTDHAKRIIDALAVMHNCRTVDLVNVRQGGNDKNAQGTWMHEDVAIIFAQWLSPEFYVWCNNRIKELFKYGITATQEKARKIAFSLHEATNILKNNDNCRTGRYKIYEQLRLRGILDKHNKPLPEFVSKGYFTYEPSENNKYVKRIMVEEEGLKWLNQAFYPEQNVSEDYLELKAKFEEMQRDQEIFLEGISVIAETMLMAKGGHLTDELNKMATSRLRDFVDKSKKIQLAIKQ